MAKSLLGFHVPREIASLDFADLPQSQELSDGLERLKVERLGELERISLPELHQGSNTAKAIFLELGCLLRRAKCGEFRKLRRDGWHERKRDHLWENWSGDKPSEKIEIPQASTRLPLVVFEMPPRLRNILHGLGLKQAGDLNGKEYRHFLRAPGMGVKTMRDLREVVQRIQEGRTLTTLRAPQETVQSSRCFIVPEAMRGVVPYELRISARLDGVLRRMGIARLGDLHGVEQYEMHLVSGCGAKTLKEALALIGQA